MLKSGNNKGENMYKFTDLQIAKSFKNRCTKIMLIMLGDDTMFWVVTPRKAHELEKVGYEYAE